ncbi:MAG: extracellular solute-binding protein [Anaerolineales bacterium]
MIKLTRRELLYGTAMVAAGSVLAACAPKATPAAEQPAAGEAAQPAAEAAKPASGEKIPIKYWVFWNQIQACEEAFRATDEWKAMEESGLEIEFGTGRGGDAGKTAVAAGTPPDVGDLGPQFDFALGGKLMDLTEFVNASDTLKPEIFFEDNWLGGQWKGMQYGVPAHECYVRRGLNMNSRLVGEAGLDINNPPQTWDELFEWHKALTKFDAAGNLTQFGIDPYDAEGGTGPGMDGWCIPELWDVPFFDYATGEFHLNDEKFAQALDTCAEFVRLIGADNLQGMRSVEGQGTWGGSYNAEVQAMIIEGYWHPGETFKEKPEVSALNVATWVPVPAFRKGDKVQTFSGHVSSLFAEGEHAKEAWPILEWLQTKACCDIIFNEIGWLPAVKDYVANVDGSKYPGLQFYLDSAKEFTVSYGPCTIPIQSFVETKYIQYRENVFRDTMTAQEAVDALQKDAETEWEESGWKERWSAE